MKVADLVATMETIAPTRFAESWDNVGLLVGDPDATATTVGLCIDYTPAVANEFAERGVDFVITYHPPIFKSLKRLSPGTIFDAIRRGVAIYSPHTALDVAAGGTNDVLADAVGITAERRPIRPSKVADCVKLVTFVPEANVDAVSDAVCAVGAGTIGAYDHCTFRTPGTGTFCGGEGTDPAIGRPGKLETTPEIRLETIVPEARISAVVAALRDAHPYEEPAFDLLRMADLPSNIGLGRIGELSEPTPIDTVLDRIKTHLGIDHLLLAGDNIRTIETVAVLAGSGGDIVHDLAGKCDLYVTGELKHHDALPALTQRPAIVCTLHSNSERKTLAVVAERLREMLHVETVLVDEDRDPFAIV
ncbi:MAG: Nif3-like dinuclear metal center hexameric protein [Planctomycetota bacterium]